MHKIFKLTLAAIALLCAVPVSAQDEGQGVVRRRTNDRNAPKQQDGTQVTERMQNFYTTDNSSVTDADKQWMRDRKSVV